MLKALYRLGIALLAIDEPEEAVKSLAKSAELQKAAGAKPDQALKKSLAKARAKATREKQRAAMAKAFGGKEAAAMAVEERS